MIKKLLMAGAAAGLVVAGAASASQLTTPSGPRTMAGDDITIDGAALESISFAGKGFDQEFSSGTAGFVPVDAAGNKFGLITADGGHGVVKQADGTGPFTRFGGYSAQWTGPWTSSVDVYLDPAWDANSGFDYSVAATRANGDANGTHAQDYVFHVSNKSGGNGLRIGATTNSGGLKTLGANDFHVTEAGYYTLQHAFTEDAEGNLDVTLSIIKGGNAHEIAKIDATVGSNVPLKAKDSGHRYGWFTFTTETLSIDNVSLVESVPGAQVIDSVTVKVDQTDVDVVAKVGSFVSQPVPVNDDGVAVIKIAEIPVKDFSGPVHLVVSS